MWGGLPPRTQQPSSHIISKDTGFDPLIVHLQERKVLAVRSKDVADIPLLKASSSKSTPERVDVVLSNPQQRGASRPHSQDFDQHHQCAVPEAAQ